MRIGDLARSADVSAKTIRYYESVGLIPPAQRRENGYRDYDLRDVRTLRFIHRARGLGFSVEDVRNLLTLWQDRERASADVKSLALRHVAAIEDKVAELESMRAAILHLAERCHGDDRPECPILDGLAAEERVTAGAR